MAVQGVFQEHAHEQCGNYSPKWLGRPNSTAIISRMSRTGNQIWSTAKCLPLHHLSLARLSYLWGLIFADCVPVVGCTGATGIVPPLQCSNLSWDPSDSVYNDPWIYLVVACDWSAIATQRILLLLNFSLKNYQDWGYSLRGNKSLTAPILH